MQTKIKAQLREIEKQKDVEILLAVESGSRMWGFESKDSDYDVRYIYLRKPSQYVTVWPVRDVIEGPADGVQDFSGWDLRKALGLLYKSNPCLFEWLSSPIVYRETELGSAFRSLAGQFFQTHAAMFHYLGMVHQNYREHMRDGTAPSVKLKKYLYIVRPLLCCRWLELHPGGPPPMRFGALVAQDSGLWGPVANALLDLMHRKQAGDELCEGPAIPVLNEFINSERKRLYMVAEASTKPQRDGAALDTFLQRAVLGPRPPREVWIPRCD